MMRSIRVSARPSDLRALRGMNPNAATVNTNGQEERLELRVVSTIDENRFPYEEDLRIFIDCVMHLGVSVCFQSLSEVF